MTVTTGRVGRTSAMGATLAPDGTGFRTWAPNAQGVAVLAGDRLKTAATALAGWQPDDTDAMEPLGDGSWGGFLAGVKDGDPYLFFIRNVGAGWKRDPFARELSVAPPYPASFCLVRDPSTYPWHDAGWTPPAFSDLLIYQLHVGTWWARDAAGNDVRATRGGSFLDVASKLGHLKALGINAIQLLPIQEFETQTSLGYNGTDMFSPEQRYCVPPDDLDWRVAGINAMLAGFGKTTITPDQLVAGINQLKCLVDLCHLHGIAVIMDQVYNHAFGHDDRGSFDDASIWFYDRQAHQNDNDSLYFTDHVWIGPVFAYWNDWVSQFLIDNSCFMLNEYRVDGFRYDEVSAMVNNGGSLFCQNLARSVRATNPAAIQIAEYWNGDRAHAIGSPPGGLGFDVELADGLRDNLRDLIQRTSLGRSTPIDLSGVAGGLTASVGAFWQLNQCLENQDKTYAGHSDAARVPMLADSSNRRSWYARSRSRVATCLLLTAPGIPALFMGEEILEDKNWNDYTPDGGLIWWDGLNGADPAMSDFLRFVSDLIGVRKACPALRLGGVRVSRAANFDRVLVMHRWLDGQGQDVVVVASFDDLPKQGYAVGLPFSGMWREVFNSDYYDGFPNAGVVGNGGSVSADGPALDGFAASAWLDLPANGALILTRVM